MRAGAVVAIALVAAVLGGLVVAAADNGDTKTVYVSRDATPESAATSGTVQRPQLGNGFSPAAIYAKRSPGVVTIYAEFGGVTGATAQGSGFVVSDSGTVLTNSHVVTTAGQSGDSGAVRSANKLYVEFKDGDRVPAKIVGWDLFSDVGVVKVDPDDHALDPVPLGNSSAVVVGEPVAAIGSPFGNQNSLSVGVVSAISRSIPSLTSRFQVPEAIQIDAPINHGNSGGPLFDGKGRVIGINAQIRSDSGNAEGVGFAIPINTARRSMEQLLQTGKVAYAYIGIETQDVTPGIARHFGLKADRGALIARVEGATPAAAAGLRGGSRDELYNGQSLTLGGDLITAIAGEKVETAEDVSRIVTARLFPGQVVTFKVLRGGTKPEDVRVRLAARPLNPNP